MGSTQKRLSGTEYMLIDNGGEMEFQCNFCKKGYKTSNANTNHEIRCKLNPNSIISNEQREAIKKEFIEKMSVLSLPVECEICNQLVAKKFIILHHTTNCQKYLYQTVYIKQIEKQDNCKFCNKLCKNNNSLSNHQRLCKLNPERSVSHFETITRELRTSYVDNTRYVGSNQYIKAKLLGLPKPQLSDETRQKISTINRLQVWDDERRARHSLAMKKAVLDNPLSYSSNNVCGRVKITEYNGEKFHGSWEVIVAKWLDDNNILWERNTESFPYFWEGSIHQYFPDLYLPTKAVYLEIKGYERDRDLAKWYNFPKKLVILKANEIKDIQNNTFVL